jgi:hypothetical protein
LVLRAHLIQMIHAGSERLEWLDEFGMNPFCMAARELPVNAMWWWWCLETKREATTSAVWIMAGRTRDKKGSCPCLPQSARPSRQKKVCVGVGACSICPLCPPGFSVRNCSFYAQPTLFFSCPTVPTCFPSHPRGIASPPRHAFDLFSSPEIVSGSRGAKTAEMRVRDESTGTVPGTGYLLSSSSVTPHPADCRPKGSRK